MRKIVAPVVLASFLAGGVSLIGCKASVQIGEAETPKKKKKKKEEPPPPPPAPTPEKPKPKLNLRAIRKIGNEIELPSPVPFETGSARLDMNAGAGEILGLVKKYMDENPDVTLLRIEGHTDSDGDDNMNLQLSKDRAMSVTKWLTENGIACKRLLPVGFGERRPLAANDTPENKQKNRRVSFFDAAVKGKPVKNDKGQEIPTDNGGEPAGKPCG
ncbi:MAG: OmpA family protein [Myxococcales bacterium]|nr:OmpA family protein [Myxococcales bacterium]